MPNVVLAAAATHSRPDGRTTGFEPITNAAASMPGHARRYASDRKRSLAVMEVGSWRYVSHLHPPYSANAMTHMSSHAGRKEAIRSAPEAERFEHPVAGLHELDDRGWRPAAGLRVERGGDFEEPIQLAQARLCVFVGRLVLLRLV